MDAENNFIQTIHWQNAPEALARLAKFSAAEVRAVVLTGEDFPAADDEKIYETIEKFPAPVILALHGAADKKLVAACHLCVCAETGAVGELSAGEALKKGLINKIAPREKVAAEAGALAEKISHLAPLAVRACLRAVTEGSRLPLAEGLKLELELFARIFSTADMREGTRAFLEKRRPAFQGE